MAKSIMLHGQSVGKFQASWLLFKESWRFFRADSELIWTPVIFGLFGIFLLLVLTGSTLIAAVGFSSFVATDWSAVPELIFYALLFLAYVILAFTYALSQASIAYTVATRVRGNNATLSEAIKTAFSYSSTLLGWSLITSTVGVLLQAISERSQLIGKIVAWLIGTGWSVLTYFVVPVIVLEDKTAIAAVKQSGQIFRSTWGETFVANITLGLVFFLAHVVAFLAFVGFIVMAIVTEVTGVYMIGFVVYGLWLFLTFLVYDVLQAIIKTLLYLYAQGEMATGSFDTELLQGMLAQTPKKNTEEVTPRSV